MLLRELGDLVVRHLHFCLVVHLIGEHHDFDIGTGMLVDFVEPDGDAQEAFAVRQVEDHDDAVSPLVVGVGNSAIPLLACCIPNLKLDGALVDLQRAEAEVDTDRANVVFLEAVILHTQATLLSAVWSQASGLRGYLLQT